MGFFFGVSKSFRAEARVTFFARAKKGNQRKLFNSRRLVKHALTAARAARGFATGPGIFGRHIHVPSENGAHRARRPCGVVPGPLAGLYGIRKAENTGSSNRINRRDGAQMLMTAVAWAFDFQGSLEAWRQGRGKTRRTAHMDVRRFRKGQDVPSGNPRPCRGPGAHSAEGAPPGWPFFWLLFFGHAKKSNSPIRAKAFDSERQIQSSRASSALRYLPAMLRTPKRHAEPAA